MTYPGLGGQQQSPVNAPAGQATSPGIQPGVSGGVVRARQVIVSDDTPGDGLFVYSGQGAAGNAPIFWAGGGGTDPFGNALPATAGVAGTGTFAAGNTRITPTGIYTYSSTPAFGNLVSSSGVATAGTDPFGNYTLAGNASYQSGFANAMIGGAVLYYTGSVSSGWTFQGQLLIDSGGDWLAEFGNATFTGNLTVDGTFTNGGSTGDPNDTGFFDTTGLASGSYGSTHQHTLPNFPTATHGHPL